MLQQQAFGSSGGKIKVVAEEGGMMTFDAISAVSGIAFHLLDEKLARTIAPDTIRRTIERLAAKAFQPSLPRAKWIKMTNPQRLEWLLNESQTLPVMAENDCAMLRARRSR